MSRRPGNAPVSTSRSYTPVNSIVVATTPTGGPKGTRDWLLIYTAKGAGYLTTPTGGGTDPSR